MARPHIQQGSFTPIVGTEAIKYESVDWLTSNRLYSTAGHSHCQDRWDFAPSVYEMTGTGWAYASRYSSQQNSRIAVGALTIKPLAWSLRKRWPLYEITGHHPTNGSKDCNSRWGSGPPYCEISVRGIVLEPTGPGLQVKSSSVSIFAEGIGTLSWAKPMDIESMMLRAPFTRGGKPKAQFRARTEGPVQIAGTPTDGNDFRWLLKPDSIKDNPVKGKFTYDTNAESVTSNATMYDLTLNWNTAMQGGRVRVSTRMRLDD